MTPVTQSASVKWICLLWHFAPLASRSKQSSQGINCTSSQFSSKNRKQKNITNTSKNNKTSMKESQHSAFFFLVFHMNNYIPWIALPKIFSNSIGMLLPAKDLKFPCADPSWNLREVPVSAVLPATHLQGSHSLSIFKTKSTILLIIYIYHTINCYSAI